jgi:hypothetical protein
LAGLGKRVGDGVKAAAGARQTQGRVILAAPRTPAALKSGHNVRFHANGIMPPGSGGR